MFLRTPLRVCATFAAAGLTLGCADSSTSPERTALAIGVAPLTLDAAEDACYSLAVANADDAPVWSEDWICASQFGFGTEITYIGTCDADDGDADQPASATNTVSLVLRAICDASPCVDADADLAAENDLGQWQNPCPANAPCELDVTCVENADAFVEFNLTIMRDANQGFFDVAVNFEDIFCSAKVDCHTAADPLTVVFDPSTDERVPSAVIAFACTAGLEADTHLYLDDVVVTCGTETITIPVAQTQQGNIYPDADPNAAPAPFVQAMAFFGNEQLTDAEGAPWNKRYYNLALGVGDLSALTDDCTLSFSATASDGALDDCTTPPDTTYPFVSVQDLPFLSATTDAFACSQHPLNGTGANAGVATDYTPTTTPERFGTEVDGTGPAACVPPEPTVALDSPLDGQSVDTATDVPFTITATPVSPLQVGDAGYLWIDCANPDPQDWDADGTVDEYASFFTHLFAYHVGGTPEDMLFGFSPSESVLTVPVGATTITAPFTQSIASLWALPEANGEIQPYAPRVGSCDGYWLDGDGATFIATDVGGVVFPQVSTP